MSRAAPRFAAAGQWPPPTESKPMRIGATADLHFFAPRFGVIQDQLARSGTRRTFWWSPATSPTTASRRRWNNC